MISSPFPSQLNSCHVFLLLLCIPTSCLLRLDSPLLFLHPLFSIFLINVQVCFSEAYDFDLWSKGSPPRTFGSNKTGIECQEGTMHWKKTYVSGWLAGLTHPVLATSFSFKCPHPMQHFQRDHQHFCQKGNKCIQLQYTGNAAKIWSCFFQFPFLLAAFILHSFLLCRVSRWGAAGAVFKIDRQYWEKVFLVSLAANLLLASCPDCG